MVTGCLGMQKSKSMGEQGCACVYVCVCEVEKVLAFLSVCSAPQRDSVGRRAEKAMAGGMKR